MIIQWLEKFELQKRMLLEFNVGVLPDWIFMMLSLLQFEYVLSGARRVLVNIVE